LALLLFKAKIRETLVIGVTKLKNEALYLPLNSSIALMEVNGSKTGGFNLP